MAYNGTNQKEITIGDLIPEAMTKKMQGFRLCQACAACINGKYELSYTFAREYELDNLRLVIDEDAEVPSITGVYPYAFLYENEMKELFGVKIDMINLDYDNKLYRISVETPFKK